MVNGNLQASEADRDREWSPRKVFFPWLCCCRLFAFSILLLIHSVGLAHPSLWVATSGDDGAPGTVLHPLATIQAALARAPGGHIMIAPGTYRISNPVVLGKANAGAILEGTGPGATIFSGAAQITPLERVSANLWRGRASSSISRVWIDDNAVPSAKLPTRFWHYITEQTPHERDALTNIPVDLSHRAFHPDVEDMEVLKRLKIEDLGNVVVVLWHSWEISKHRIARIDSIRNIIYLTDDTPWAFHQFGNVQRYQLDNVPGIVELSGNWYINGNNWIYFQTPSSLNLDRSVLVA